MKGVEAIERYLTAQAATISARHPPVPARLRPIVTISRQAGAGGHSVAEALLELFEADEDRELFGGWQLFDRELCEIVAEDPACSNSLNALLAEEYSSKPSDFFRQILGSTVDQDLLAHEVFRVVRAVASIGKCIILGRAASQVTTGMGPRVSVRIVAPEADRIRGVMRYYELPERAARERAAVLDGSRARLLKSHFQVDIDDPTLYDATWNTGQVPIAVIAESIALGVRRRVEAVQPVGTS